MKFKPLDSWLTLAVLQSDSDILRKLTELCGKYRIVDSGAIGLENMMSDKTPETLLDELLQMGTEQEREAYLARVCKGDDDLRDRLENLLSRNNQAGQFFQDAGLDAETEMFEGGTVGAESVLTEVEVGCLIGRYKILEKIGEGGMGDVYMAEQVEPVSRMVALKIIKLGMDTKQVVARFEAERQALAMMDHPNIARVHDGGATETGRPYFVMELVRGLSITEFCDKKKVCVKERLKLFMLVCEAVQSAHQKGVIHRDIKPSNILVTLNHGEAVPKVIDFGIAKATNQRLTEKTLFTKFAQMIGTPAYMSPEQAEMTSLNVDTRTDVYSLGVLLYELLTGAAPFSQEKLMSLGYQEMQRIILEVEPDKPSTRITKTGKGNRLDPIANQEESADYESPSLSEGDRKLAHSLRGDLDWITMKALEKDRRRRYGTPNELAADLERHLQDEPVTAAAPSLAYQLGKLYRRRRSLVRWVTAVALIVIVSAIVSGGLAIRLNLLRNEAVELRASEAEERANAERERDRAVSAEREVNLRSQELGRQLYVSDMVAVERAVENEEMLAARDVLKNHIPIEGGDDPRGFEWRYFWGQSTGDQIESVLAHRGGVSDLEVSPDGRWMATAGSDGLVKLWDLAERKVIHEWDACGKWGGVLSFSSDQRFLAIGTRFGKDETDLSMRVLVKDLASKQDAWAPADQWGLASMSPVGLRLLTLRGVGDGALPVNVRGLQTWDYANKAPEAPWELPASLAVWSRTGESVAIKIEEPYYPSVEVWDVNTRERTHAIPKMTHTSNVVFSRDNQRIGMASGWRWDSIYIWDLGSNKLQCELRGHESFVTDLVFHPTNPEIVASCSNDQTIRIWNWKEEKLLRRLIGHTNDIETLAFTRTGERLISGSKDGRIMFWDVKDQSSLNLIPRAYTIDKPFFSSSGNLVSIVEWTGFASPNAIHPNPGPFETRGEHVAKTLLPSETAQEVERRMIDAEFLMVSLDENTEMPQEGNSEMVVGRALDGALHFKMFAGGSIYLDRPEAYFNYKLAEVQAFKDSLSGFWNKETLTDAQRIEFATTFFEITQGSERKIWQDTIFQVADGTRLWEVSSMEKSLAFTPNEARLLTLNTNRVFFREARTGKLVKSVEFDEPIWNSNFATRGFRRLFDLSPDGSQIAVTELEPAIRIIDIETGSTSAVFNERLLVNDVRFSPNGDQLVFRSTSNQCGHWDPRTNKKVLLAREGNYKIVCMDVSPNGQSLAAACDDNAIRIWRFEDGSLERTIRGLRENLSKVAFAPDGKSLALLRNGEPKITFWNTRTWRQVAAIDRVSNLYDAMGFSPDGTALMMSGRGGTRIWRAPTLDEIDRELNSRSDSDLSPR